ncbi:6-bladed beta-propeller [Membranicola marinus]|uniref:6-bladed beta-propeller n=1 Tax=Membranihabitans marinus TaxID=1227546 RepID=A0A953HXD0_9BACT|nr:6-bladed beta-propeller [Membranihabitans marinus]MBY5960230.1 6-bladed beta-propeller [Membranihabitans marinus]
MLRIKIGIIGVLFIFMSCENQEETSFNTIPIHVDENDFKDHLKMSAVFDSIEYLKLDDAWPIGNIEKLLQHNGKYVVLDKGSVSICLYSSNGDLIHRINKIGKGPGEYISIIDFTLNEDHQIVALTSGKLIFYDFSGNLIREIPLKTVYSKIQYINNGQYLFYSPLMKNRNGVLLNEGCAVTLFSLDDGFDCLDTSVDDYFPAIFTEKNLFSKNDSTILFSYTSSPVIYEYSSHLDEKYEFIFSGSSLHQFPEIDYQNFNFNNFLAVLNNDKNITYHRPNLFHNSEWIITNLQNHGRNYFFYNIKNKMLLIGEKLENDVDHFIDYFHPIHVYDNSLIGYVFPYELPDHFRNDSDHSSLFENDNPILIKLALRSYDTGSLN